MVGFSRKLNLSLSVFKTIVVSSYTTFPFSQSFSLCIGENRKNNFFRNKKPVMLLLKRMFQCKAGLEYTMDILSCSSFDDKTAVDDARKTRYLKTFCILQTCISEMFPAILTDNGGKFSDASAIENALDGQSETKCFFVPNFPYQKPRVETNHTLFRGIVESGTQLIILLKKTLN